MYRINGENLFVHPILGLANTIEIFLREASKKIYKIIAKT